MDVLEEEEYTEDAPVEEEPDKKVLIISCSGDLERTWATLIIATTAAAMGMQASIFFTFWGFFPLVRNDVRITGETWMQKMLSFMNRGGTEHLKMSKMNFAGMGPAMMKKIARDHKTALPTELLETARDMGVRLLPCQMSMDLLGLKREDLIVGVEEPVGATTMLLEAQGATTLFI
jgi:peroxiredoxin family protein